MNGKDISLVNRSGNFEIQVTGRANFEYAVPLREIARTPEAIKSCRIDLRDCAAMDSTFMGVLTMLALGTKRFQVDVEIYNASDFLVKLLRGLGIEKLFVFKSGDVFGGGDEVSSAKESASALTTAETVAEAHRTLVEADGGNAQKFADVIEFADQDVARLKKAQKDAENSEK